MVPTEPEMKSTYHFLLMSAWLFRKCSFMVVAMKNPVP